MSYEEFFHLKDAPFRLTPDPDYFFPSGVHKEALDTMLYSIRAGEGFVMITGTPGVGKTLLVRKLLRELGDKVNRALVLNPTISPRELLTVILDDLGITTMEDIQNIPKEILLRRFRDYLLDKSSAGTKTIIIIDEAQNLPKDTLEELRMLSNLESDKEKLLQIILVGQLELEERLQYDDMKQLAQRVSIRCRLKPLSPEETGAYVRHRLEVAGDAKGVRFRPRVLGRIHALSSGIPRRINLICERALMAAYVDGEKSVSKKHLARAIKSIEGHEEKVSTLPGWLLPALGGSVVVLAALWVALQYNSGVLFRKDIPEAPAVAYIDKPELPTQVPSTSDLAADTEEQAVESRPQSAPTVPTSSARYPESSIQQPVPSAEEQVPQSSDLSPQPSSLNSEPSASGSKPISKTDFQTNARVLPETPPVPEPEEPSMEVPAAPAPEPQSPEIKETLAQSPAPSTQGLVPQPSALRPQSAPSAPSTQVQYLVPESASATPEPDVSSTPQSSALSPQTSPSTPQSSVLSPQASPSEAPVPRQPPGELVQYLDANADPSLLPVNEFYLSVDRDNHFARLLQGGASGSVVKYQFELDWRIMEGLYLLGIDRKKGPFVFNPVFLQMGGYDMPNTAELWDQVKGYVADDLVPVIVYAGSKTEKELLTSDIPTIREIVNNWAQAWRDRDMTSLMSFYGKSFTSYSLDSNKPETYPLADLTEIRSRTIGTSTYISLKISTPVILTDPQSRDFAIAVFRQEYKSNNYSDKGIKVLYFRREGIFPERPWKIVAKFFLPTE